MKVVIPNKKRKTLERLKTEIYLLKKSFTQLSEKSIEAAFDKIQELMNKLDQEFQNR
jgi:hypothetical protein